MHNLCNLTYMLYASRRFVNTCRTHKINARHRINQHFQHQRGNGELVRNQGNCKFALQLNIKIEMPERFAKHDRDAHHIAILMGARICARGTTGPHGLRSHIS